MAQMGMEQEGGAGAEEIVQNTADTIMALSQAAAENNRADISQALQKVGQEFMTIMSEFIAGGQKGGRASPVAERGQGTPMGPQGVM
jgi:hypothetical protein